MSANAIDTKCYNPKMVCVRETKNISLTAEQAAQVEARVASGRYQNASEVVRAGLRLLEEHEAGLAVMRQQIQRGVDSLDAGAGLDGPAVMAELRDRAQARRDGQAKSA